MTTPAAPTIFMTSEPATPTEGQSEPMQIIWKIEATAPEAISIIGQGMLEELGRALYNKSNVAKALFGSAPIALSLKGGVAKGEDLLLTIESNPSTGASWQVVEMDTAILSQAGETYYTDATGISGSFQHQVIPLKAIADGVGVVTMLYGRPWESAVKPVRQVSIEAKQLKDMLDLTDPMP
jgi:predicted secreted protein